MNTQKRPRFNDYYNYPSWQGDNLAYKKLRSNNSIAYPNEIAYQEKTRRTKRKVKSKKRINPFVFLLSLAIFASYGYWVCPYVFNKFTKPLYVNRVLNRNIKLDVKDFYNPTSKYLNNSRLLNSPILINAVENNKDFAQIRMLGELSETREKLLNLFRSYPRLTPAVYVWEYSSGRGIEINSDEVYEAASIIKIPIAFELMRIIDDSTKTQNPISLQDKRTFSDKYRTLGSGKLQYTKSDVDYSLNFLANIMISESDNSASNMILEEIGGIEGFNRAMRNIGLEKTRMFQWLPDLEGRNKTTAKEISTILYNINNPHYIPKRYKNILKEYLASTKNIHLLKEKLPSDAMVLHKTGNLATLIADSGIIYTTSGKQYIVTILVKHPKNDYSGKILIQEASKIIYDDINSMQ